MKDNTTHQSKVRSTKLERIVSIDNEGVIIRYNEDADSYFCFGPSLEIGKSFFDLVRLERQEYQSLLDKVLDGTIVVTKIFHEWYDGEKQTQAVFKPVDGNIDVKIYP